MQRRRETNTSLTPGRASTRAGQSPNLLFTAITIGAVLILLAATFLADWLRVPQVTITSAPQYALSSTASGAPAAEIGYRLSEDAIVSAEVISPGGGQIKPLLADEKVPGGQHALQWDGKDYLGRSVADGSYQVQITAKGTLRSSSASATLLVDTTPPALQLVNLSDGSRVKSAMLMVEGVTEPGATVLLEGDFQPVAVDGQGHFRAQHRLSEGSNSLTVRASDAAGNTTVLIRNIELVTSAPAVVVNEPTEGSWVNNSLVTISGTAPLGTALKINNQTVPITQTGDFHYELVLEEGDQTIQVNATDDVGNVTSVQRFVHVKTRGPSLELNVADGALFNDAQVQIQGRASPGALVMVDQHPVTLNTVGAFQSGLSLTKGDNIITVTARDQAGNITTLTRRLRYEVPTSPSGGDRLLENVQNLPPYTLPVAVAVSLLIGLFFYRQNHISIQLGVDQQEFVPGMPEEGKTMLLRLDLNQTTRVTLEVLDANGNVQSTLLDNRRRTARQHVFVWDGYDDFGRLVTPGIYTIRATAGSAPMHASSAVQVRIERLEEMAVPAEQAAQDQRAIHTGTALPQQPARRLRQNRKRV